jgi:hypothetical protein
MKLPCYPFVGRRFLARQRKASDASVAEGEDLFEGIKLKIEKKKGFQDWLKDVKAKLAAQPKGPFYLGGSLPFSHNPLFVPQAPITDALRNRIFELNQADPVQWSPRKLSAQFKVAIPRIKAIVRMKTLEAKQVAEGKLVSAPEYVSKMEEILGARTPIQVEFEPVRENSIANHLRPMFVAVPETAPPLSFEDDARLLNKPVHSQPAAECDADAPAADNSHGKFIQFDAYEKARHAFVFVDMTKGVKPHARALLVREPNGDLRTGQKSERLHVARRVWGRSAKKFMG